MTLLAEDVPRLTGTTVNWDECLPSIGKDWTRRIVCDEYPELITSYTYYLSPPATVRTMTVAGKEVALNYQAIADAVNTYRQASTMANIEDESILICALRYAHGRHSYVVAEACGWVRDRWSTLSQGTRDVIRKDLEKFLDGGKKRPSELGMDMDAREWRELAVWIGDQS